MVNYLRGKAVTCDLNGDRTHDRWVGICYADGVDIGAAVIAAGPKPLLVAWATALDNEPDKVLAAYPAAPSQLTDATLPNRKDREENKPMKLTANKMKSNKVFIRVRSENETPPRRVCRGRYPCDSMGSIDRIRRPTSACGTVDAYT